MPLSDISKTNFVFKKIKGRRDTANEKAWYEEFPGYLVFLHADDVWSDPIPTPAPGASTSVVQYYNHHQLTEDSSTPNHKAWLMCETPGDTSTQLRQFVPPRFHQTYTARVYDNTGTEIPTTDPSNWFFDYENGVLFFEEDPTTHGWSTPISVSVYRYIGNTVSSGGSSSNKLGAFLREASNITVSGGSDSIDVSSQMTGKTPGGNETTTGVATDSPNNLARILTYPDRDEILTSDGNRVYGRLTESSGTWTLSFYYVDETGTEQTYTFANNTDIIWAYYEVLEFADWPVFRDDFSYPSDQIVGDIPSASTTIQGKVIFLQDGQVDPADTSLPWVISGIDVRILKLSEFQTTIELNAGNIDITYKGGIYNTNGDSIADGNLSIIAAEGYYVLYVNTETGAIEYTSDTTTPPDVPNGSFGIYRFSVVDTGGGVLEIQNITDIRPIYVTSGGMIKLGIPSDGTYDDGLLDFTEDTYVNDAIDEINEILKYLAPEDAEPLLGIDWVQTFYTGKVSNPTTYTANGYITPGTDTNYITTGNILNGPNTNLATSFNKADQGSILLNIDGTDVDSFDLAGNFNEAERDGAQSYPPATSTNNYIQIDSVEKYNNFPLWQKGNLQILIGATFSNSDLSNPNDHRIIVTHDLDTDQVVTYDIFLDQDLDPDSVTGPNVTENTPVIKELSGVKFYGLNSTFDLAFSATNAFRYTYLTHVGTFSGSGINTIEYNIGDTGVSPSSEPVNDNDTLSINTTFTLDSADQFNDNTIYTLVFHKPVSDHGPYQEAITDHRMIDTYADASDDLGDFFVDENYRLPDTYNFDSYSSGITGQWDSTVGLTNGNAQVIGHQLIYPHIDYTTGYLPTQDSDTNYSTFTGDQVYYRAMQQTGSPHSNGTIRLGNITWNDISSGNIKLEIKLPTQTGWLDLSQQFNVATFTGADGDGAMTSHTDTAQGVEVSWSAGTFSTADSGYRYYVRLTIVDNTKIVTSLEEIGW